MKRYVIERDMPGRRQARTARSSRMPPRPPTARLTKLAGKVQWVQSYVVDDKTFCVYLAENEAAVQEHARLSGFPANKVSEVRNIIDPMTAQS